MTKAKDTTQSNKPLMNFLSDRPVAYHPLLAKKLKSVKAAVFLSQLLYWHGRGNSPDGWIYKNAADFYVETGLSRKEQETARMKLVSLLILEHELRGVPATSNYRINEQHLIDFLTGKTHTGLEQSAKPDSPKVPNQIVTKCQTGLSQSAKLDCPKVPNWIGTLGETRFTQSAKQDSPNGGNYIIDYNIDYNIDYTETTSSSLPTQKKNDDDDDLIKQILQLDDRIDESGARAVVSVAGPGFPEYLEQFIGLAAYIPSHWGPGLIINALKKRMLPTRTTEFVGIAGPLTSDCPDNNGHVLASFRAALSALPNQVSAMIIQHATVAADGAIVLGAIDPRAIDVAQRAGEYAGLRVVSTP